MNNALMTDLVKMAIMETEENGIFAGPGLQDMPVAEDVCDQQMIDSRITDD